MAPAFHSVDHAGKRYSVLVWENGHVQVAVCYRATVRYGRVIEKSRQLPESSPMHATIAALVAA
jgi:hypothetical protein